ARRDQNKIAITFDDGPNKLFTPKILDILAEKQVRATFFMLGRQAEAEPEVVAEVLAAGHVVGNHTYSHPDAREGQDGQFWREEVEHAERAIQQATGKPTAFFRMPYLRPIPDDVQKALDTWLNNRCVLYSEVMSYDWTHSLEEPMLPQAIADK